MKKIALILIFITGVLKAGPLAQFFTAGKYFISNSSEKKFETTLLKNEKSGSKETETATTEQKEKKTIATLESLKEAVSAKLLTCANYFFGGLFFLLILLTWTYGFGKQEENQSIY
jgi:hypothetical protein